MQSLKVELRGGPIDGLRLLMPATIQALLSTVRWIVVRNGVPVFADYGYDNFTESHVVFSFEGYEEAPREKAFKNLDLGDEPADSSLN